MVVVVAAAFQLPSSSVCAHAAWGSPKLAWCRLCILLPSLVSLSLCRPNVLEELVEVVATHHVQ